MAGTRITRGIPHIGHFVKAIRRKNRVSQREVAASVGVDLRTIQRMESQSTDRPTTIHDIGCRLSVTFATIAFERVNKPLVLMVTNPCASTGSSTLCVALAGCYAGMGKRVLLLYGEQNEDWGSFLESRPVDKPKIDCCLLEGTALLKEMSKDCTEYDVIIVDFVRLGYIDETEMKTARTCLRTICGLADVILVPFQYSYPSLRALPEERRTKGYICLEEELQGYAQMQKEANVLLLMNHTQVPDEGYEEDEDETTHIQDMIEMNSRFRANLVGFLADIDQDGIRVCESMIGDREAYQGICHERAHHPYTYEESEGNSRWGYWITNGQTPADMPLTRSQQAAARELKQLTDEISRYSFCLDMQDSD